MPLQMFDNFFEILKKSSSCLRPNCPGAYLAKSQLEKILFIFSSISEDIPFSFAISSMLAAVIPPIGKWNLSARYSLAVLNNASKIFPFCLPAITFRFPLCLFLPVTARAICGRNARR